MNVTFTATRSSPIRVGFLSGWCFAFGITTLAEGTDPTWLAIGFLVLGAITAVSDYYFTRPVVNHDVPPEVEPWDLHGEDPVQLTKETTTDD